MAISNGRRYNKSNNPRQDKTGAESTFHKSIVHIEPYKLWIIKFLKKYNIVGKEELTQLFEQYLESRNLLKAQISPRIEQESDEYLVRLEPTKWKDQDHYLVLGLQHLRYKATEEDIRRAHKRKALKHHPDKREKNMKVDLDSDYYSCITRAMDIVGDPVKRTSYDSVDPLFDENIPAKIKQEKLRIDDSLFYKTFGPAFDLNARWSIKSNVPYLGNKNSSKEYVEGFYEFWYNFQSWREFSYLDEEDKEKGEDRYERRWLDKQNKAARQQRKKQEMQRIRQLVDNAYSCDPRIVKFKEDAKRSKEEEKKARKDEIQRRIAREQALEAEEQRKKQEEEAKREEEERQKKLELKRLRENAKKQAKKEIKSVYELCKEHNFFVVNPNETVKHLEDFDKLMKSMASLEIIKEFKNDLTDANDKRKIFLDRIEKMNAKLAEETEQTMETVSTVNNKATTNGKSDTTKALSVESNEWTVEDVKLLVKAVGLFPAGTTDRWEVVAKYLCVHSSQQRSGKQVIEKVKQLKELFVQSKRK